MQELLEEPKKDEILIKTHFLKIPTKIIISNFYFSSYNFRHQSTRSETHPRFKKMSSHFQYYFFKNLKV